MNGLPRFQAVDFGEGKFRISGSADDMTILMRLATEKGMTFSDYINFVVDKRTSEILQKGTK